MDVLGPTTFSIRDHKAGHVHVTIGNVRAADDKEEEGKTADKTFLTKRGILGSELAQSHWNFC